MYGRENVATRERSSVRPMPDIAMSNLSASRSGSMVPNVIFTSSIFTPPSALLSSSSASMSKPSFWPVVALRMLNTGVSMVVPTRSTLPARMRSMRSCAEAGRAVSAMIAPVSRERIRMACPSLFRGPTAVEDQRRAGHQRRRIGREKHDRAGQLLKLAQPAELDALECVLAECLVLEERPRHRRLDEGWADGVDADVVRR